MHCLRRKCVLSFGDANWLGERFAFVPRKNKVKEKQLSENKMVMFNIASTVIIAGLNFITAPVFTRMLDQAGYGIVTVYSSWVQIFSVFVALGLKGAIGTAKANLPEEEQDSFQFSALVLSFLSFSSFLLISLLMNGILASVLELQPLLVVCVVVQSFGSCLISFFNTRYIFKKQANRNFAISVTLSASTLAMATILIILIPADSEKYFGWVLGFMFPNIAIGLFLSVRFAISTQHRLSVSYWGFALPLTLPLILHGLSGVLLSQLGKISIQHYYDDSLAAIFGIAVTVASLINSLYYALNSAFVPFMYDDLGGKTSSEKKDRHFYNYFSLFTLAISAYMLFAPEVLKVIAPPDYWSAIPIVPILLIGQYFIFLYSFPVNFEFFKAKTKYVASGTMLATMINIVLVFLLVPTMGMDGAALSSMASYAALFVFHFLISRILLHDRNYPARWFFYGVIFVCGVAVASSALCEWVVVRWIVGFCLLSAAVIRITRNRSVF